MALGGLYWRLTSCNTIMVYPLVISLFLISQGTIHISLPGMIVEISLKEGMMWFKGKIVLLLSII